MSNARWTNYQKFLWRNLRARHEIRGVQRKNVLEIPEDALRESVINAACHRDYFEEGANVMVEIYDDRVVITNPGGLPKGISLDDLGTMSVTRNPFIADMLYRAEYNEKMGTGIKKVRDLMEDAGLEAPAFTSTGFFTVTFKRPQLHIPSIEKTPEDLPLKLPAGLTDNEVMICKIMSGNDSITVAEISRRMGVSKSTAERIVRSLIERGIIERVGPNKSGTWKVL